MRCLDQFAVKKKNMGEWGGVQYFLIVWAVLVYGTVTCHRIMLPKQSLQAMSEDNIWAAHNVTANSKGVRWGESSEFPRAEQITAQISKITFLIGQVTVKLLSPLEESKKIILSRFQNCIELIWQKALMWFVGRHVKIFATEVKIQDHLYFIFLTHGFPWFYHYSYYTTLMMTTFRWNSFRKHKWMCESLLMFVMLHISLYCWREQ